MADGKRGPYAKGKARRKQILDAALTIIAVEGFDHATLSKISKAVGITDVAVLHYFDSMDDLMVEVLKQRDANDVIAATTPLSDFASQITKLAKDPENAIKQILAITARNMKTPGLVELYAHMSVRASNPKNPAYKYFKFRGMIERNLVGRAVTNLIKKKKLHTDIPAEDMARIAQAIFDGLQIQWLLDRDIDMPHLAEEAINLLQAGASQPIKRHTKKST
ncbi:MAG: TetR/AcrR family transcriptional regulator, partial [Bifidobacterium psychraerophilum]|uniref:TetR/AcrR family transcriptional regulator n=1 Tax=Bifidobacterium psychraerophilum TaxID=218140 RepID=UPI0039E9C898